jgi:hypothetical protein
MGVVHIKAFFGIFLVQKVEKQATHYKTTLRGGGLLGERLQCIYTIVVVDPVEIVEWKGNIVVAVLT